MYHNVIFFYVSGNFGVDNVETGMFMDEIDRLCDSFNSNQHAPPFKKLLSQFSNDSPHVGYWVEAGMELNTCIFLKDGKPTISKHPPSQNGWLVNIGAVQHV